MGNDIEWEKVTEAMKLLAHMVKDAEIENKLVSQETIDAADTLLALTYNDDWTIYRP